MADSLLKGFLKAALGSGGGQPPRSRVLNVGGNSKEIAMPPIYDGWEQLWLDIDPAVEPDILCDARELLTTPAAVYDAVYCSHNLEHYYRHDAVRVLQGFRHILRPGGFVHIRVPDVGEVMRAFVSRNMDIHDVLYISPGGPITVHDVLYGWGKEIESSGQDFFAHKTGFTEKSLHDMLRQTGFQWVYSGCSDLEIMAYGFYDRPDPKTTALLGLPPFE